MYWPIGTPRIHATTSTQNPNFKLFQSHDGEVSKPDANAAADPPVGGENLRPPGADDQEGDQLPPQTPITPLTPAIQPVEQFDDYTRADSEDESSTRHANPIPSRDPILALRVARTGHLFVTITKTSITVWQTKVRQVEPSSPCLLLLLTFLSLAYRNSDPRCSIRILYPPLRG